jgi:hypothetical protein
MKLGHSILYFIWVGFLSSLASACQAPEEQPETPYEASEDTTANELVVEVPTIHIDSFHTALAKLFSGIDHSFFEDKLELDSSFWSHYSEKVDASFLKIKNERLDSMRNWFKKEGSEKIIDTCLLFYPFSGADFLHAYYFFPDANNYLLLAKEKIGELPDLDKMDKEEIEAYLNGINYSLRDIYKRSYFITKNMTTDTRKGSVIKGLLPLFYWFIARTDHEIISVTRITIDSLGKTCVLDSIDENSSDLLSGIEFQIRKIGQERIKRLTYFDCDISNEGFTRNPELKRLLDSAGAFNTYVKSASYLMHYRTFNDIRNIVLELSNAVLEDDTGIPLKYFKKSGWNINLYGHYTIPVRDFSKNKYQTDLKEAYANEELYKGKLPFSLGYHWGTDMQNQMLYIKQ